MPSSKGVNLLKMFHVFVVVSCGEPATPVNGRKQGSTYIYGSSVVYACTTGYNLQGSKTVTCQANGHWSSGVPTCAGIYFIT